MKTTSLLLLSLAPVALDAFAVYPKPGQFSLNSRLQEAVFEGSESGIQNISLETLSSDHEAEGSRMAKSIAGWLDQEWMPQQVHIDMGDSAKKSYIEARKAGETDIMSVMFQVSSDLEVNWPKYDADAFVNAWDVGNYVSDYLNDRAGNESCECASQIFVPEESE